MFQTGDFVEVYTVRDYYGRVKVVEVNPRILVVEYRRCRPGRRGGPVTDRRGRLSMERRQDVISWKDIRRITRYVN